MTSKKPEIIQRCALPGCDELIEVGDGLKPRKFCCAAHRAIARQRRREAEELNALQESPPRLVDIDAISFDTDANGVSVDGPTVAAPTPWSPPDRQRGISAMSASAKSLAAKSLAARAGGREFPTDGSERIRRLIPTLGRGTNGPEPKGPDAPGQRPEDRRLRANRRRTQTVALIGAIGILAGGGGYTAITATNGATGKSGLVNAPAITPVAAAEWAQQAEAALQSVERQLNLVAQVKEEWLRSPAGRSGGAMPTVVRAMFDRETSLLNARTTIQSQLATYQSMGMAAGQLAAAQAELTKLDRVIQTSPTGPSAQQKPDEAAVRAEREIWQRQKDTKSVEVATLGTNVQHAMSLGLPDPAQEDTTRQMGDSVLGLARGEGNPEPAPGQGRQAPVPGISPREKEERPGTGVNTGAPPRPSEPLLDITEPGRQAPSTGAGGGGAAAGGGGDDVPVRSLKRPTQPVESDGGGGSFVPTGAPKLPDARPKPAPAPPSAPAPPPPPQSGGGGGGSSAPAAAPEAAQPEMTPGRVKREQGIAAGNRARDAEIKQFRREQKASEGPPDATRLAAQRAADADRKERRADARADRDATRVKIDAKEKAS